MPSAFKSEKHEEVRRDIDRLNSEGLSADRFMDRLTLLLNEKMLKYNWVGFYMLEKGAKPPVLVLGHFQGAMTHTRAFIFTREFAGRQRRREKRWWLTT